MIDDIMAFAAILVGVVVGCMFIFLGLFLSGFIAKLIATPFLMGWFLIGWPFL